MSYDAADLQKFLHGLSCLLAVQIRTNVTAKILRLRLTQKLNNHRGSDVRGDKQFELSLQND